MAQDIDEMRKKIDEYVQKQAENAQLISIKELVRKAKELRTVYVEGIGTIQYGSLTLFELSEIAKCQTNEEKTIMTLYFMLKKAEPSLTLDDVKELPFDIVTKILNALSKEMRFLTAQ
ncbi:MAG: hypothetical protein QXN34_06850 [Archaeoglobaceae archaeon]